MRGAYLLIAIGMGMQVWPGIFQHGDLELFHGVSRSMLGAMTLLCLLGVRYPLAMLPILFFEFAWKSICWSVRRAYSGRKKRWNSVRRSERC